MHYSYDLCFLCLVYDENIKLEGNNYLQIIKEFHYLLPEHISHNSESPKYVCKNCMKSLNEINIFRRKCLKNISIYNEYEQKLRQYSNSLKYLTIACTDFAKINAKIFETEDSRIGNENEINEICKVAENEEKICDELNCDVNVKKEVCQNFVSDSQTEFQSGEISNFTEVDKVTIKDESNIENNYIKHEFNEELIIKEDDEQNDIFNQNMPENYVANKNDFDAVISMCTQSRELPQNKEMIKCVKSPKTYSRSHKFNPSGDKPHACDVCQRTFSFISFLERHKLVHTGEKPFECDVCLKTYSRKGMLKTHKLVHTGERQYSCDECQKRFVQIWELKAHKLLHSTENPYVCDVCQKAFKRKDYLTNHKFTHSGFKPHVCDVCQKSFKQKSALNTHRMVHTGEKPHVCDVCQKKFARRCDLKLHKLVHTGEKPYSCDACQKKFRQISRLKVHKLLHTVEKPYVCDVCQKAFNRKDTLKAHKLSHSGDNHTLK